MFYHDHAYGITRLNVYCRRGRWLTACTDPVERRH